MSFMFRPLDYDDWTAINRPNLSPDLIENLVVSSDEVVKKISSDCRRLLTSDMDSRLLLIDGYVGAKFDAFVSCLTSQLKKDSLQYQVIRMEELYKSKEEIDEITSDCLPDDIVVDPVLLFGKLFNGGFEDLIDDAKLSDLLQNLKQIKHGSMVIIMGKGSTITPLRAVADSIVYLDVTPKNAAVRARRGQVVNIGDKEPRPFNLLMRRNYYVDFEVITKLRKDLLMRDEITYYLAEKPDEGFILLTKDQLTEIFSKLCTYPFRSKPVYLEGIWGGEFIRKIRNIPMDVADNIAWIFEFIPMEVSIVVSVGETLVEFPFSTFLGKCGEQIVGQDAYKQFGGYFPIRFNYDDTFHSNGNMSIQVHPPANMMIDHFNEKGAQDEAYYIVATGHEAKTYLGFREDANPSEFIDQMKKSEIDGSDIDYPKYINSVQSIPGKQVMIPAGTIHSSGRNQFVLELGSLSIGSYTFKLYDYNRRDKEGKLRPIHSYYGEKVLDTSRTVSWVNENLVINPILVDHTNDWTEWLVGHTDLMYYETYRIDLLRDGIYHGKNHGQFTVLTVVDGEKVEISSKQDETRAYRAKFLEIIVVPAMIEEYTIKNLGYQPAVIHKTVLCR